MFSSIRLQELNGVSTHLAGFTRGEAHLAIIIEQLRASSAAADPDGDGEVLVLDFDGIEFVTGSYVKATLLALLELGRKSALREEGGLNVFLLVANAGDEVLGEIHDVMVANGAQVLSVASTSTMRRARLLGRLDAALDAALRAIAKHPLATATQLKEANTEAVSATAWNNRMADLLDRRLVRRRRAGRQNFFVPLADEVSTQEGQ